MLSLRTINGSSLPLHRKMRGEIQFEILFVILFPSGFTTIYWVNVLNNFDNNLKHT